MAPCGPGAEKSRNRAKPSPRYPLDDLYAPGVFDLPTYEMSIEVDGNLKKVKDDGGLEAGMPFSVYRLENAVDQTADTKQWISVPERGH